jgi:hypothetical protein
MLPQLQVHAGLPGLMIPQIRGVPESPDDLSERCLYATFNADEILDELRNVLDNVLKNKQTQEKILREVATELQKAAWNDKLTKIVDSIRTLSRRQPLLQSDIQPTVDEVLDIITYLQLLGGLDPPAAKLAGIPRNFSQSFEFLKSTIRKLLPGWPDGVLPLRQAKQRILFLCFRTMAELVNANLQYFESYEQLNKCLTSIVEFDNVGNLAPYFTPAVLSVYDRLQVAMFRMRPSSRHLQAAIRSASRTRDDLLDLIETAVPDDARKFNVLYTAQKGDPRYRQAFIRCAEVSDDPEVILQAFQIATFPKSRGFMTHYFSRLSEALNDWLSELLDVAKRQNPLRDGSVRSAYQKLQEIMKPLKEADRVKMFMTVQSQPDVAQALCMLVRKGSMELTGDDPMVSDLKAIVVPLLSM